MGGFLPVVLHLSQPADPNSDQTSLYIGRASIHSFKTGREMEIESLAWIADHKMLRDFIFGASKWDDNYHLVVVSKISRQIDSYREVSDVKKRICTGQLEVQSDVLLICDGSNVTKCIRFCVGAKSW